MNSKTNSSSVSFEVAFMRDQLKAVMEAYRIANQVKGLDLLAYNTLCANIRYNGQLIVDAAYPHHELLELRCKVRNALGL